MLKKKKYSEGVFIYINMPMLCGFEKKKIFKVMLECDHKMFHLKSFSNEIKTLKILRV